MRLTGAKRAAERVTSGETVRATKFESKPKKSEDVNRRVCARLKMHTLSGRRECCDFALHYTSSIRMANVRNKLGNDGAYRDVHGYAHCNLRMRTRVAHFKGTTHPSPKIGMSSAMMAHADCRTANTESASHASSRFVSLASKAPGAV